MYSKNIAIILTVVIIILSFFTYSISDNNLAYTILLIALWFPIGVAIFIDSIKFVDKFLNGNNQLKVSQIYMGIKLFFGFVLIVIGLYSLFQLIINGPVGISSKIMIFIFICMLLLQGVRMVANAYLSLTNKNIP